MRVTNNFWWIFIVALLMWAALIAGFSVVYAQDAAPVVPWYYTILGGVQPLIAEVVMLAVAGLLAWLVKLVRDKFGIEIEAKHREALQSALNNAINLVIGKVLPTQVTSSDLDVAVKYVKESVPDAVKNFDLDTAGIKDLLKPKLAAAVVEMEKKPSGK